MTKADLTIGSNLYFLIEFQGLTIVDVYSEWSGPCSAMTNFLKKIKLVRLVNIYVSL